MRMTTTTFGRYDMRVTDRGYIVLSLLTIILVATVAALFFPEYLSY
jgi:hypothetical protein